MQEKKERKEDRRTRFTKEEIRNAFLRLKRNNTYNDITVSAICREAEINRGTFYLHYNNMAEVLDEIIDGVLNQVNDLPAHLSLKTNEEQCPSYPFCHFIRDHVKYQCVFFDDSLSSYIIDRLAEREMPLFMELLKIHTDFSKAQIEALFYFQMNGCLAVCKRYAGVNNENWSATQCTIDDFLRDGFLPHLKD